MQLLIFSPWLASECAALWLFCFFLPPMCFVSLCTVSSPRAQRRKMVRVWKENRKFLNSHGQQLLNLQEPLECQGCHCEGSMWRGTRQHLPLIQTTRGRDLSPFQQHRPLWPLGSSKPFELQSFLAFIFLLSTSEAAPPCFICSTSTYQSSAGEWPKKHYFSQCRSSFLANWGIQTCQNKILQHGTSSFILLKSHFCTLTLNARRALLKQC